MLLTTSLWAAFSFSQKLIMRIKIIPWTPKWKLRKKQATRRTRNKIDFQSVLAFSPKAANAILLLFKSLLGENTVSLGN